MEAAVLYFDMMVEERHGHLISDQLVGKTVDIKCLHTPVKTASVFLKIFFFKCRFL